MIQYNSLAECDAVINTLKSLGQEVPEWILNQRKAFIDVVPINSIYEELKKHSKFPYSAELIKCITDAVDNLLVNSPKIVAWKDSMRKDKCL